MADQGVKLFLSCVSDEFGAYRDELRRKLTRPNVEVKIQEDFKALGGDTLSMLEDYIAECEAVVHFAGEMTGSTPAPSGVADLLARRPGLEAKLAQKGVGAEALASLTYTQWEAWLAIAFDKDLLIVAPAEGVVRGPAFNPTDASRSLQADHLTRLRAINRYPGPPFTSADNLIAQIFGSAVIGALVKAAAMPARQPRNLPFASLGPLFMGRDDDLRKLHEALAGGAPVALTGLGGVGKTRLAIEYALRHGDDKSALLMARADNPSTLEANLAALASAKVLDLKEQEAPQDSVKVEAALRWLGAHPAWLMILDNVDDEDARDSVVDLLARLNGGCVVITARAANFPASVLALELGVLDEDAATAFLMDRTRGKRAQAADDPQQARALAHELGGLALGLEQAGAYIAANPKSVSFAGYLKLWRGNKDKALQWFDPKLMAYAQATGLAATWETSVNRLSPESRRLLERLAMLAPDPVPNSLIDVAVPGEAADTDALEALAGLYAYSLVTPATAKDGSGLGFVMHRLVQDFARRAMTDERRGEALREALGWADDAFIGDPQDVRSWPVLDPLAPHVLAVARRADEAGIAEPIGRLLNQLGLLLGEKARFAEAEPLLRRALAIDEASFDEDHPNVAADLNNLATLHYATNRLGDAEPLMRRALAIDEASFGEDHPTVARNLNNLALLLRDTNRLGEAEPLMRRALAIDEASFGEDHPNVARDLNNLAQLLRDTNRLGEAEPLMRRALAIDEESFGADHPNVARDLNNLAGLLQATNRLGEAERLMRRPLAIDEASFGEDHPNVARDLNNLALLLKATNRLGEAEPLMRRALAIDEASFGQDHPEVATDLNNLALLLRDTNRLGEAEPLMRRALAIDEASFGQDHPDVARDLNNLARLLQATNRRDEAEPLMRRALAICEKSLGADHPNTVLVHKSLAALEAARSRGP